MSLFKKAKSSAEGLVNTLDDVKKNVEKKITGKKESSFSVPLLIAVGLILTCGLVLKKVADSQSRVDY